MTVVGSVLVGGGEVSSQAAGGLASRHHIYHHRLQ